MAAPAAPAALAVHREAERARLDGTIDFTTARAALAEVAPAVETTPGLVIDLGGIRRSNSAGLALIVEWLGIARRAGHAVTFANVPDGLLQLARVCQVDALLADAAA